jgi:hypothetical protein
VRILVAIVTVAMMCAARPASAQATTPPSPAAASDTSVRTLLSWLDDAEVIEPGGAAISIAATHWSSDSGHETDVPSIFAAVGVAPRVQLAAAALHYSSTYTDGFASSGRGDVYLISKIAVVSPRDHPGGIAISPLIEVLSDLSLASQSEGASRVSWGIPISLQYTTVKVQVLGSAGYFSRGSLFGGAGVEAFVAPRVIAAASLLYSHATTTTALSEEYGLSRNRTDFTGGIDVLVSPAVTVFATLGRTIAGTDSSSTNAIATLGLSLRLAGRPRP